MDSTTPIIDEFALRQRAAHRMFLPTIPARLRFAEGRTFELHGTPEEQQRQRNVLRQLSEISTNIKEFCFNVGQLFFWGRVGTGKDHLAIAMGKKAVIEAGYSCRWFDAMRLYDEIGNWTTRAAAIRRAIEPDIIILSDAVWNRDWTEPRKAAIRRVVNERWFRDKATWVTVNVTSIEGDEENSAKTLMVKDVLDRLLDGAERIHCNWESKRPQRKWKNGTD